MTLSEELCLLAHDDAPEGTGDTLTLDHALAAALLLDLAAEELLVVRGKTVVAVAGAASHPLLAAALTELLASEPAQPATYWLARLPSKLAPLRTRVTTSLANRGALAPERRAALGLDPAAGWPTLDAAPEHELRSRLHRVLVYAGEPDARTALLVSLLRPLGLARGVIDEQHHKQADARAKAIAASTADAAATPAGVARPVHAAQAAVLAAELAPPVLSPAT